MTDEERLSAWEAAYEALLVLMSRWGQDLSAGRPSDYFVIDDDWGGMSQKVEIVNPNLPMPEIIKAIQSLLASKFTRWDVIVVFDDGSERKGLRIFADRIIRESEDPNLGLS